MAKIDPKYENLIQPDTFWSPYRYYALAAYVFMFNAIKENPLDYGISSTNLDKSINDYIKTHFDELNKKFGFNFKSVKDADFLQKPGDYKQGSFKLPCIKEDFLKDFDSLVGEAWTISKALDPKGKMMSNADMRNILYAKEVDAKSFYENIRNNSKFKQGNIDPKEGKDKSGRHAVEWETAQIEDEEKRKNIRRNGRKTFLHAILTGLAAVGTIASAGTLLSFGGLALGSLFGTAVSSAGLGAAALGLGGTIAGGWLTKTFFGKFIEKWSKGRVLRQDRRDFHSGLGKYVTKDGKAKGFRSIRDTLKRDLAFKAYMDECGKHPEYLLGYGKDKDGNWIKKLTPEEFMYKFVDKKYHKYLTGKYVRGEGFGLHKLVEAGLNTAFVNQNAGKNYGFSNIYSRAATVVNEYNIYEKSVPEIVSVYNNFFESDTPEAVKQRADIDSVVGKLGDLKTLQKKFDEAGDVGHAQYNELTDKFAHQIENSLKDMLLTGSFDGDMLNKVEKALADTDVEEAIKSGSKDLSLDHIKSINRFITVEAKAGGEINEKFGVSAENQLFIDSKHILAGCAGMVNGVGRESEHYPVLEIVANKISSLSTKRDADAIITHINNLKVDDNTKDYLGYMLEKKKEMTGRSSDDISQILTNKGVMNDQNKLAFNSYINSISDMKKPDESIRIREQINNDPKLSSNAKTELCSLLDEQIISLKTAERRQVKGKVVNVLQNTKNTDLETWMGKISEIKADITSNDVESNYRYKISGIRNEDVRKYLMLRLKDRLTKAFCDHIGDDNSFVVDEETPTKTMGEIRRFMKKVSSFAPKYIDEWQKQKCLDAFGDKINLAFEATLKTIEENYLDGTSSKVEIVRKLLYDPMQKNGFKEYFDSNTATGNILAERLKRIYKASSNADLMKGSGLGVTITDNDAAYNKKLLKIYFSEKRETGDDLTRMLQTLRNLSSSSNIPDDDDLNKDPERLSAIPNFVDGHFDESNTTIKQVIFDPNTDAGQINNVDYNKSFVYNMINVLKGEDFNNLSNKDKLATIYVMRKYVVAMFRAQMAQFKTKFINEVNNSEFIRKHEPQIRSQMVKNWKVLAVMMDKIRNQCNIGLDNEFSDNVNFEAYIQSMGKPADFMKQIDMEKTMDM